MTRYIGHNQKNRGRTLVRGWAPFRAVALSGLAVVAFALVACGGNGSSGEDEAGVGEPGMSSGGAVSGQALTGDRNGASVAPDTPASDRAADEGGAPGGGEVAQEEQAASDGDVSAPGGGSPQPIADVLGRQVIRNGSVELTVGDVGGAFDQVRGIADQAGGYLASSSFSGHDESQYARMTLRIPAEKFDQVVADLRAMAVSVDSVSTSSQDVTEEYTDLEASLRNLHAVEEQYLTLLGETTEIGEILQVQDRLNGVRYEIERVQGRLNVLDNQTSLATLEVALYPESSPMVAATSTGFGSEVGDAWESSLDFLADAGTAVAVTVVWAWWLIPVLLVAAFVLRRALRGGLPGGDDRSEGGSEGGPTPRVDTPEGAA